MPTLQGFRSTFPFARGGVAFLGQETTSKGAYTATVTGLTEPMDFAEAVVGGQWKFTAESVVLDPDILTIWTDLPVAVFNQIPAGTYTFSVTRYNEDETIALGPTRSAVVEIPQPAAPDPSVFKRIIITDYYNARGQVRFVLWAEVPLVLQAQFARPGLVSEWAFATAGENAALAAGEVAELAGGMTRGEKTNSEVRADLEMRWARYNETINDVAALSEENTFWLGDRWMRS